jgi:hypothetical protein
LGFWGDYAAQLEAELRDMAAMREAEFETYGASYAGEAVIDESMYQSYEDRKEAELEQAKALAESEEAGFVEYAVAERKATFDAIVREASVFYRTYRNRILLGAGILATALFIRRL